MASLNKVTITGKIYNLKVNNYGSKTVSTFGLSVWNGKDKETGQNTYEFINCKYWHLLEVTSGDKVVTGKLAFDTWEKDGKKNVRPYILVDSVVDADKQAGNQNSQPDNLDDEIPFN